ncbi:uncharacterized protein LOC125499714 isoform X2 [Athalia rosae]|uniref:uncharacterized protein LOC125499714 isoform X2 n=1 Tax=Athalia rosae TaxID=37344 RepID=UPI0020331EC3|nr:uncharacterized protein LOC125499714 isoform X2 [Athalia rosae]
MEGFSKKKKNSAPPTPIQFAIFQNLLLLIPHHVTFDASMYLEKFGSSKTDHERQDFQRTNDGTRQLRSNSTDEIFAIGISELKVKATRRSAAYLARDRRSKKTKDSKVARFIIHNVAPDTEDNVTEFLSKYFLEEEETRLAIGTADDPRVEVDARNYWKEKMIDHRLLANSDPEQAKLVITGVNIPTLATEPNEALSRSQLEQVQGCCRG